MERESSVTKNQFTCEVEIYPSLMEIQFSFVETNVPSLYLYDIASIEAHKEADNKIVYTFRDSKNETIFSAWHCIVDWTFKYYDVPPYFCEDQHDWSCGMKSCITCEKFLQLSELRDDDVEETPAKELYSIMSWQGRILHKRRDRHD